ncbi:MAG: hypothetical protein Q4G43_11680 [Mobilicoccus sp.]|nr:hypothetical protein [Mobilicoccus sp.]
MTVEHDQVDLPSIAMDSAASHLAQDKVWVVCVVHLAGLPHDFTFTAETARSVLDEAQANTEFPTGAFQFAAGGYQIVTNPDHRIVTLGSESAPHLEAKFGFGDAGVVATGFTRSGQLDDGTVNPGAVVLSDMEAVASDAVILAFEAAVALGYEGPVEAMIGVSSRGTPLSLYTIDEIDGGLTELAADLDVITPVRASMDFSTATSPRDVHLFLHGITTDIATQFGTQPQHTALRPEGADYYQRFPESSAER